MSKILRPESIRAFAVLCALAMVCWRLGDLPLRDPDEGRNAEVAREMALSETWIVPTLDGIPYLDKPALFFKMVAGCFALFGESERTARLPSVIFAMATLGLVYCFCRAEYDRMTAALSVLIVATSPLFFVVARHVIFDMPLVFFVCASTFAGYFAEKREGHASRNLYFLSAASAGVATLIKGPVGFFVPFLTLIAFNAVQGRRGWIRRLFNPLNFLVFFIVTLPWFVALSRARPDFPRYGLIEETFNRFTTGNAHRRAPFYYYGLVIMGGLFAWSVILPGAIIEAWRRRRIWTSADRLLIVWALGVTGFFSLSQSKLPHYILSGLIALGILLARLFAHSLDWPHGCSAKIIKQSLIYLACFAFILTSFLLIVVVFPNVPAQFLHIKSTEFTRLTLMFPTAAVILAAVTAVATIAYSRQDSWFPLAAFIILPLGALTVGFKGLEEYSEASSSRNLVRTMPALSSDTDIACLQCFPCGLPFYMKRKITLVSDRGAELTSNYIPYCLRRTENWPDQVIRQGKLEEWLSSRKHKVFLISNTKMKPRLDEIAASHQEIVASLSPGWWGLLIN